MIDASAPRSVEDPIYDAFRRHDRYGTMGAAKQPWWEYIRLAVLAVTVAPLKLIGCFTALLSFWVCCKMSWLIPRAQRSDVIAALGKVHCRVCAFFLGFVWVRHECLAGPNGAGGQEDAVPCGIVANHAGYADILLLMALYFPSFVARDSTQNIPFIGIISQMMDCMYVDRSNGAGAGVSSKVKQRMEDIASGKRHLRPVLLFPEGTTTNNQYLLPFRTGAFLAGKPLKPVVLLYSRALPLSMAWESVAAHWHIFLALANPLHAVTVLELPVYVPSVAEAADPKLYARNLREVMLRAGGFASSPATFAEKQEYLALLRGAADLSIRKKVS